MSRKAVALDDCIWDCWGEEWRAEQNSDFLDLIDAADATFMAIAMELDCFSTNSTTSSATNGSPGHLEDSPEYNPEESPEENPEDDPQDEPEVILGSNPEEGGW